MQNRQARAQQVDQVAAAHGCARLRPAAAEHVLNVLRSLLEPAGGRQHRGAAGELRPQRLGFRRGGTPLGTVRRQLQT
jgi:hypothetical protein